MAQLTPPTFYQAGTLFSNDRVGITRFSNTFTFQLHDPAESDGITFIIQGNASTAMGGTGGGLGYGPDPVYGGSSIPNSAAVKFDLYNNQGEGNDSTGLFTDGHQPTVGLTPPDVSIDLTDTGIDLHSGHIFQVDMTYDGTTLAVTILDTQTLALASQSYAVDIPAFVGSNDAFVGFGGGTGAYDRHPGHFDVAIHPCGVHNLRLARPLCHLHGRHRQSVLRAGDAGQLWNQGQLRAGRAAARERRPGPLLSR